MPIPTDTYWNIRRLNVFFAASAILLMAIMGWSVVQDYDKSWRAPQRDGKVWQAALVDDQIAQQEPKVRAQIQEIERQIAEANAGVATAQVDAGAITAQIQKLESQKSNIEFDLNNKKALLTVAESGLQDAITRGDREAQRRIEREIATPRTTVSAMSEEVARLAAEIATEKQKLRKQNEHIADLLKAKTRAETDLAAMRKKRDALQPSGILPTVSTIARRTPLLQFVNPAERVQQVVVRDVLTDVSFMKITTIDRCVTCHVNISNKDFTETNVLAFLERQTAAARGMKLPATVKASEPQVTATEPGAAAMPEFWHGWARQLTPDAVSKAAPRIKSMADTVGKGATVTLDGKPVQTFAYLMSPGDEKTAARQDAILGALVRAWAQFPAEKPTGDKDATVVDTKAGSAHVKIAAGATGAGPARAAALRYADELRAALLNALETESERILFDRYRRALVAEVNAYRDGKNEPALDDGRVLLAHPNLSLYVDVDSKHSYEQLGCTSCHDGSGQETDFVLAAHTARDIWVDEKTGAPLLTSQLRNPPAESHAPTMASMLEAVYPHGSIVPDKVSDLHLTLGAGHEADAPAAEQHGGGHGGDPLVAPKHLAADAKPTAYVDPVTGRTGRAVPQIAYWSKRYERESGDAFSHVHHRWDWPMRSMHYIEANCVRCHTQVSDIREHAPIVNEGRALFANMGCANCHHMESIPQEQRRPVGPDLRHVTAKLTPQFINTWVWAPKAFRPSTKMPHFFMLENNASDEEIRRTRQEARAITEYLVRTATPYAPKFPLNQTAKGSAEAGRVLFESVGCQGCHTNLNNPTKTKGVSLVQQWITTDLTKKGDLARRLEAEVRKELEPKVTQTVTRKTTDTLKKKLKRDPTPAELAEQLAVDLPKALDTEVDKALKKRVTDEAKATFGRMTYNERQLYVTENLEPASVVLQPQARVPGAPAPPANPFDLPRYPDGTPKPLFMHHGPELSAIGTKLLAGRETPEGREQARQWLFDWLKDPHAYSSTTVMPNLRLTDQQALDLTEYLLEQKRTNSNPDDPWKADLTPPDKDKLAELAAFFLRNRYSVKVAAEKAVEETFNGGPGEMTRGAIEALTTPTVSKEEAERRVGEMNLEQKQLVFLGKKLISHYGCANCHRINGTETMTSNCPNLSDWGQKGLDKLDFAYLHEHTAHDLPTAQVPMVNGMSAEAALLVHRKIDGPVAKPVEVAWPHVEHSREDWITHKLKNSRVYDRGKNLLEPKVAEGKVTDPGKPYDKLKMPTFYLSDRQVHAIVTFVISNRDRLVSDRVTAKATTEESKQISHGRFLTQKYNCVSCHQVEQNAAVVQQYYGKDDLTTKAPPSLRGEGNKVHHGWLFNFLRNVEPLRPLLEPKGGIRMPSFYFENEEEVEAIAAYFAAVSNKEARELRAHLDPIIKHNEEQKKLAPPPPPARPGESLADASPDAAAKALPDRGPSTKPTTAGDKAKAEGKPAKVNVPVVAWYDAPPLQKNLAYLKQWALDHNQMREIQFDLAKNKPEELGKNYDSMLFKAQFVAGLFTAPYPFADGTRPTPTEHDFERGRQLFFEMQCLKCHMMGEVAADAKIPASVVAPNLGLAYHRLQRRWTEHWVQEPAVIQIGTAMPPFFSGIGALQLDGLSWPRSQNMQPPEVKRIEAQYGETSVEQKKLLMDFLYAAGARNMTIAQPAAGAPGTGPKPLPKEDPPTATKPDSAGDPSVDSPSGAPSPESPQSDTPPKLQPGKPATEEMPAESEKPTTPDQPAPTDRAPAQPEKPAATAETEKKPAPDPAPAANKPGGPVSVKGKVTFTGEPPEPAQLDLAAVAECHEQHPDGMFDESLVVNENGTLRNVLVRVTGGLPEGQAYPAPSDPVVLDQKGCQYVPHVIAMMPGQPLIVKNSDAFLHNVHSLAQQNPAFNFGQPTKDPGKAIDTIKVVESFRVKCDVHPWMSAFVHVLDNPFFAITGADGSFELRGLPPGQYTLTAWHEQLGEKTLDVSVEEGKPATAEIAFEAAAE